MNKMSSNLTDALAQSAPLSDEPGAVARVAVTPNR